MTWRGIGPSGQIATLDIGGGQASFKYEFPQGDISGVIDNIIVIGLQGRPISNGVPVFGNVLAWDGINWSPSAVSGVAGTGVVPHNLLSSTHVDTNTSDPFAGDLIVGSGGSASWVKLPVGSLNQSLRVSDIGEAFWSYDPIQIISAGSIVNLTEGSHKLVLNKTVGAPTIVNLPLSPFLGQDIRVKDGKGDSDVNQITVQASGITIDGFSKILLKNKYQSMDFMYNGTEWNIV